MSDFRRIQGDIQKAMLSDRHRLERDLRAVEQAGREGKPQDARLRRLLEDLARSVAVRDARLAATPKPAFDDSLPIHARRDEIAAAIREHQVVVVSGETGSGKSTQLPKICLALGRGIDGMIGHTQPRRIAARSIAVRVAEELGVGMGREVGFKIRFADATSPRTYVKLMTDGILLAETQGDRLLSQYDTIILDEAHERSLNVDFLIGYLKRLLPKRPELTLIITSATIDSARFARHFSRAGTGVPVIEVSGRSYPVEIRYRPPQPDAEGNEPDLEDAVLAAVKELARIDHGDMLIFMPTERDIHEVAKGLRGASIPGDYPGHKTEILPLYARLPAAQQQRVFEPHAHRRIVIATNVAESSLTVPGVRYVIDPGTARISRYSARSKTQRLPIEPVSQASADQRAGRCGRLGPGICIRLFGQEDYAARDRYAVPEILRSNLASVILQTKALRLGEVEGFPFLDPPKSTAIRDGYRTLFELGALDEANQLTELGWKLSRLPVDPRIGRMILAAGEEDCLHELLIIAAALAVRDPRERPMEKPEEADACHARFADGESDFLGYLKLWDFYHELRAKLSRNQLRKACRQNFLSHNRMREWTDIHLQLLRLVDEAGMGQRARRDDYDAIHRAVLTGLLANVAFRGETYEYTVAGGGKAHLWPGSALFGKRPKWVVGAELVETSRRYLRTCGRIDPRWIEPLADHLVKRTYSDPHWDAKSGSAVASERVSLFGLVVVPQRRVAYGPINPAAARELFIQHGLVEGQIGDAGLGASDVGPIPAFLVHNQRLLQEMERLQAKLRRHDLLRGERAQYEFYDDRIPPDVYDLARLNRWRREAARDNPRLLMMTEADLVAEPLDESVAEAFPDAIPVADSRLPLDYRFEPGSQDDGLTLTVPLEALSQIDPERLGWLVPGLLEQKVTALIKSLPKAIRRNLVPAPDTARKVAGMIRFGEGSILDAAAAQLGRIAGMAIRPEAFQEDKLPDELRMNVRVVDDDGNPLAAGRDLGLLRQELRVAAAARFSEIDDPRWNREGVTRWDFEELPAEIELSRGGFALKAYPALVDGGQSASLRLMDSPERAARATRGGLRRLFCLAADRDLRSQVQWLPGLDKMVLWAAPLRGFDVRLQLAELIADRAFVADVPTPRSAAEFDARLRAGRGRIAAAVQDVAGLAGRLFEAFHQASLAIEQATSPPWQYAVEDARGQLDRLAGPDFLTATPWEWLVHCPRYFRAIAARLDKLRSGGLARDRRAFEEDFLPRREAYLERVARHEQQGIFDPELVLYRWMLEEFRVSLFGQQLGTSIPVSAKRLDRQWASIRE
jgi:ATP-dependent helicase HrpA